MHGQRLNLSKLENECEITSTSTVKYNICKDIDNHLVRPIIKDEVFSHFTVGPAISHSLCIKKDFTSLLVNSNTSTSERFDNLPVSNSITTYISVLTVLSSNR